MFIISALKKKLRLDSKYTMEEASALYTTTAVSDLALSLIGIYLPIFIYTLSLQNLIFSQNQIINGLIWNCVFYFLLSVSVIIAITLFTEAMFSKLHLKKSLFIGILLRALSLVFILLAEINYLFLILSALVWGFRIAFYWIPYHIFFVRRADDGDHRYGTEIGKRGFFSGIATSLAPLLGGLVITNLGYNVLFMIGIVLLLLSSLPTLIYVSEKKHGTHKVKDAFKNFMLNKKYVNTTLAFSGNITSAVIFGIFWSILLFLKLENFVEIGLLNTVSGILATVLLLLMGKIIDSHSKKGIHGLSVLINSLLHISRLFLITPMSYYLNNILDKVNSTAYSTCFTAATYEKPKEDELSNFMVYRELTLHGARIIILPVVVLLMLLTDSWMWVFIIGAAASGLSFLINF